MQKEPQNGSFFSERQSTYAIDKMYAPCTILAADTPFGINVLYCLSADVQFP